MFHYVFSMLLSPKVRNFYHNQPLQSSPQHLVPSCFFGRSARPFERAQPLAGLALEPMGLHDLGDQLCPGLSELPRLSGGNCSTSQFTPWKKNEKERKRKKKRPNHPNPMNNTTGTHPWYDSWAHPSTRLPILNAEPPAGPSLRHSSPLRGLRGRAGGRIGMWRQGTARLHAASPLAMVRLWIELNVLAKCWKMLERGTFFSKLGLWLIFLVNLSDCKLILKLVLNLKSILN